MRYPGNTFAQEKTVPGRKSLMRGEDRYKREKQRAVEKGHGQGLQRVSDTVDKEYLILVAKGHEYP